MDHVGPLLTSARGNKYVLVIIDNLTRFAILKATKDTKTTGVVRALNEFIIQYGAPIRVILDRGTCFTVRQFSDLCQQHVIRHVLNSPRHAQANGMVERLNGTLLLRMQVSLVQSQGRDWDNCLKYVQRDLNTCQNQATGKSPFELLYGYFPKHDEGALRTLLDERPSGYTPPATLQDEARTKIMKQQEKYKTRYDRNRVVTARFHVGDIVAMSTSSAATGESNKFQPRFRGALTIVEVLPADTYRVLELRNDRGGKRYSTTAHASQLKIWRPDVTDSLETNVEDTNEYETNVEDTTGSETNVDDTEENEKIDVTTKIGSLPPSEKSADTIPRLRL